MKKVLPSLIRVQGPVDASVGALTPIGTGDARIEGGFWGQLQSLNATAMIAHCEKWMERLGWIGNFDAAVEGRLPEDRRGREFSDSDVYKLLEAMAWELMRTGDSDLKQRYDAIVSRVARAQEPDGYVNTCFGRPGQGERYSDLEWGHELYGYGHLMQAAVARGRSHIDDLLVQVARRAADHVCETFGENGIQSVCGHPGIEPALVEFSRLTGDDRYLEQARLFLERRGTQVLEDIEFGRAYFQDDVPVRSAEVLRGHAVRATYLAAGAIDYAVESGDTAMFDAVESQLRRTLARRTYITGGMGAHHEGESFGSDFELPSERAYSETCAGVGSVMAHYRLLLATGDAIYGDIIERTLYNVVATSPGADGRSFFYTNTLHRPSPGGVSHPDEVSPRAASSMRSPWFSVSCCPPNVARTIASLDSYLAATDGDALYLVQYAPGRIRTEFLGGVVEVEIKTEYPQAGQIRVRVISAPPLGARIVLRVPQWAGEEATLTEDDSTQSVSAGWASTVNPVKTGDEIVLNLPMRARVTYPDPRIDALRGQLAVERGPLVMCLERMGDDLFSADALHVAGDPLDDELGVRIPMVPIAFGNAGWPYGEAGEVDPYAGSTLVEMPLIPYNQWGNRGPATMRVWLPIATN
jgi:DUF1680 family protein